MEENFSDTGFSVKNSMKFFYRWRRILLIVFAAAVVVSTVVSFLVQPRYKSTAVLFPASTNRMTKSIMAERYSMDIVDYGIERDCEYAIQILSSQSMMQSVSSTSSPSARMNSNSSEPAGFFTAKPQLNAAPIAAYGE